MKCPVCNANLREDKQTYPAKYNIPDILVYTHPKKIECQWSQFTYTKEHWQEIKSKLKA